MHPFVNTFEASHLQAFHAGQVYQAGRVTMTHTGNQLAEVNLSHGDATCTLSLRKGGAIVSAILRGQQLFEKDPDYDDLAQMTRTKGNPNIFPVFNRMPEGVALKGAQAPLPNHGIARNQLWQAFLYPNLPDALVLQLTSNDDTRIYYPYAFTYTQFITLEPDEIIIDQHIETDGAFSVGFHPYFVVSNKRQIDITGIDPGTPYWYLPNSLSKSEKDAVIARDEVWTYIPGKEGSLNFTAGEVNHHFDVSGQLHDIVITDPGLQRRIILRRTADYQGLTVWSEALATAVCVEPVTDRSGQIHPKPSPWIGRVSFKIETF